MSDPALMIELLELHAKEDAAHTARAFSLVASLEATLIAVQKYGAARIAELEAERDRWHGESVRQEQRHTKALDERDAARAERDRLKAALKPFAVTLPDLWKIQSDDLTLGIRLAAMTDPVTIKLGDLRVARVALSGEGVTK